MIRILFDNILYITINVWLCAKETSNGSKIKIVLVYNITV